MDYHKLLFIGPVGAGKTSAIRAVCDDHDNLETEAKASDMTGLRKATTTVAMDYGCLTLNDNESVQFYGTPGQSRFKFMWELLANNLAADCAGIVFLVDNTRNYPMRDLKYYSHEFSELIARKKVILGVTRSDLRDDPTVLDYQKALQELGIDAAVRFIDARKASSVLPLVKELVGELVSFDSWSDLTNQALSNEKDMVFEEVVPEQDDAHFAIQEYIGEEVVMKDAIIDDVMNLKGVRGAVLTDDMGEIITSSIESPEVNDFVGFVAGVVKVFEEASGLGSVHNICVKSNTEDNLSIFVGGDKALGVQSSNRVSVRTLKQQVDDLLQWS
ncbi:ATP/GTP-binding protein [Neptunomonas sp.]|uniref:GTP-binding protein n=1 Tax=Neptunomonas sp. TaxID=1971898 RepID=UPI0025CF68C9|nr:ATP/GTP-binding protein [Neptunomonas sp.]